MRIDQSTHFDNENTFNQALLIAIKKIARYRKKSSQLTLQTTEIVHEAFLIMEKQNQSELIDKQDYLAKISITLKSFIIDQYRKKQAQKNNSGQKPLAFEDISFEVAAPDSHEDWTVLDEKLNTLKQVDKVAHQVVELRYFAGFTESEVAAYLNVSRSTVTRKWHFARSWLHSKLSGSTT